jgi:RNA polymerase sigma-70 factor, ECF subfamily
VRDDARGDVSDEPSPCTADYEAAEAAARDALATGDVRRAAGEIARAFGAELLGFLIGVLEDGARARAVYGGLTDRIVEEVACFTWQCPLRVWAYAMARRELEVCRGLPSAADTMPSVPPVILADSTTSSPSRPPEIQAAIAALRGRLSQADRELLILRIDRAFAWPDLAITSLGEQAPRAAVDREAERLEARFTVIRGELARELDGRKLLGPR